MELNEEEKKAIEHYKMFEDAIKQTISKGDSELYIDGLEEALKDTEVILNLIEKQQKEIERLENIKNICPITNTSGMKCELKENGIIVIGIDIDNFYDDYIAKSKIKEINENTDMYYEFYDEVMKLVESEEK